jgi:hypothetical protein
MITFDRPDENHLWQLANNMRQSDIEEVQAGSGDSPFTGLVRSVRATPHPIVVIDPDRGEVLSAFGVCDTGLLTPGVGVPWFLASKNAHKYVREYATFVPPVMEMYREAYHLLVNYVDARNKVSIRWLKRLGFTIEDPIIYGCEQRPFHRFYMES